MDYKLGIQESIIFRGEVCPCDSYSNFTLSKIDNYFEKALGICDNTDIDKEKYNAWLTLFGKIDSPINQHEFLEFMQKRQPNI